MSTWYGRSAVDRFMAYVEPEPTTGCWIYTGPTDEKGYGLFQLGGRTRRVNRLAFRFFAEQEVPADMTVDHLCLNIACVNIKHLEIVTREENTRRARARRPLTTHCPRGHELTPENTRISSSAEGQHRHCRTCGNAHAWGRDRDGENARARELRALRGAKSRGPYQRRLKGGGSDQHTAQR